MSDSAAWTQVCSRNMRGETVRFADRNWTVVTHLRNGVWLAERFTRARDLIRAHVRLNFRGQPYGTPYVFRTMYRERPVTCWKRRPA